MSETMSHPQTAVTGPPQNQAVANDPTTPVGNERMQKETPKLVSTGGGGVMSKIEREGNEAAAKGQGGMRRVWSGAGKTGGET